MFGAFVVHETPGVMQMIAVQRNGSIAVTEQYHIT